jgi:hypothetical protein
VHRTMLSERNARAEWQIANHTPQRPLPQQRGAWLSGKA